MSIKIHKLTALDSFVSILKLKYYINHVRAPTEQLFYTKP